MKKRFMGKVELGKMFNLKYSNTINDSIITPTKGVKNFKNYCKININIRSGKRNPSITKKEINFINTTQQNEIINSMSSSSKFFLYEIKNP